MITDINKSLIKIDQKQPFTVTNKQLKKTATIAVSLLLGILSVKVISKIKKIVWQRNKIKLIEELNRSIKFRD